MRFTWDELNDPANPFGPNVFGHKIIEDPGLRWETSMPDITSLREGSAVDPAFASILSADAARDVGDSDASIMQYIARNAIDDCVRGTRQLIGEMVQTTGVGSNVFPAVQKIFTGSVVDIRGGFDAINGVLDSKTFDMGMNMIGAIPVIGWIIKIGVNIGKAVAGIAKIMEEQEYSQALLEIQKRLTIPLDNLQPDKGRDEIQTRIFFERISKEKNRYNPQGVIVPAYSAEKFYAEGVYEDSGQSPTDLGKSAEGAAGWVVHGEPTGGIGYIPGTAEVSRSLFFPAGIDSLKGNKYACRQQSMRDLGTLYPSTTNIVTSWWSQVLKPGPAMFSVDPRAAVGEWENYIEGLFGLCKDIGKDGWTCVPTAIPFTNEFVCTKPYSRGTDLEDRHKRGFGGCKAGRWGSANLGDIYTIPDDFGSRNHFGFYLQLVNRFFNSKATLDDIWYGRIPLIGSKKKYLQKPESEAKWWTPDSWDYSKSIPVKALQNLYDRQVATLDSLECMYVNGEDEEGRRLFGAFNNSSLRNHWRASVTAILNSNDWRRVVYADVPEGPAKAALREVAHNNNVKPEDLNPPCPPGSPLQCSMQNGLYLQARSVLGDPSLPQPAPLEGMSLFSTDQEKDLGITLGTMQATGASKGKKGGGEGILLLGAAAAALMIMKGRGK